MSIKSIDNRSWIIAQNGKDCYEKNKNKKGSFWACSLNKNKLYCCKEDSKKPVETLLKEYQNKWIPFDNKLVQMNKTEELIMAAFVVKLVGGVQLELTRDEILNISRTNSDNLTGRELERLVARGLIKIVYRRYFNFNKGKIIIKKYCKYILSEKGKSYCTLYQTILLPPQNKSFTTSYLDLKAV